MSTGVKGWNFALYNTALCAHASVQCKCTVIRQHRKRQLATQRKKWNTDLRLDLVGVVGLLFHFFAALRDHEPEVVQPQVDAQGDGRDTTLENLRTTHAQKTDREKN